MYLGTLNEMEFAIKVYTGFEAARLRNNERGVLECLFANNEEHSHLVRMHRNQDSLISSLGLKARNKNIFEHLSNRELLDYITARRFSELLAKNYFKQILHAVGHCHSLNIYHRGTTYYLTLTLTVLY